MDDLYAILQVTRNADEQTIRKAYHKAAMKYHPDKQGDGEDTTDMFVKITDAFAVLSNESLRASYDQECRIRDQASKLRDNMCPARKHMIAELNRREKQADEKDPLDVYREDLRNALKEIEPVQEGMTFEEYEKTILSALSG